MTPDVADARERIQIIAHRGASGDAPESTLEAYRLALALQADFIEMDAHRLKDGTIVIIHDSDVARTTDRRGKLSRFTLSELKTLDAGSWFNKSFPEKARPEYEGLRIPTLDEVIDIVAGSDTGFYIEIKEPEHYPPDFESLLLSIIHNRRIRERTTVFSFSARSIMKIKALDPGMRTALLVSGRRIDPIASAIRVNAEELSLRHDLVTRALVSAARENELAISAWTVDKKPDMQQIIQLGVDRVVTNYPGRLRQLLNSRVSAARRS
ncbi:MAG: hypothetical protein GXX84_01720 [Acidobacteria bacterium]|nr:hypothetical protein [Acidobacteriota bacterium]